MIGNQEIVFLIEVMGFQMRSMQSPKLKKR